MDEQRGNLEGVARGMGSLRRAWEFGAGERLGLTDVAHAAASHAGGMLEQLRHLHEARIGEIRARGEASG
jgi:hypothetical protein